MVREMLKNLSIEELIELRKDFKKSLFISRLEPRQYNDIKDTCDILKKEINLRISEFSNMTISDEYINNLNSMEKASLYLRIQENLKGGHYSSLLEEYVYEDVLSRVSKSIRDNQNNKIKQFRETLLFMNKEEKDRRFKDFIDNTQPRKTEFVLNVDKIRTVEELRKLLDFVQVNIIVTEDPKTKEFYEIKHLFDEVETI